MTKENQKILYVHYMKLSKEGETDKQRTRALKRANDILKSFPEFADSETANPEIAEPEIAEPEEVN